ncbi:MAG TPA: zinc ribbon domain-containing protein [Gemmatimonadaceae bacterium]|nr:zinc ribbon domain-containing protein [Gemmatimonadaceae bacterium]
MDDLDRLYRRLVQNIRNGFPDYVARPFEVAEVYQSIVPYRHNRRELGIETNQDYELALCRLISGERAYVTGDEHMQESVRRELASPNPNTAVFRDFAATRVALAPEALRRVSTESGSEAESVAMNAGPARARVADGAVAAASAGGGVRDVQPLPPSPPPPRPPTPPLPASLRAAVRGGTPGAQPAAPTPAAGVRAAPAGVRGGECRFCNGALPDDRRVLYCPHCGQNLAVRHCPACGSEVDASWRFCITCGREVGAE